MPACFFVYKACYLDRLSTGPPASGFTETVSYLSVKAAEGSGCSLFPAAVSAGSYLQQSSCQHNDKLTASTQPGLTTHHMKASTADSVCHHTSCRVQTGTLSRIQQLHMWFFTELRFFSFACPFLCLAGNWLTSESRQLIWVTWARC